MDLIYCKVKIRKKFNNYNIKLFLEDNLYVLASYL